VCVIAWNLALETILATGCLRVLKAVDFGLFQGRARDARPTHRQQFFHVSPNPKPEIRDPKADSASSPFNAEAQRFAESSSGEKLKLGKQKAEIQRPALSIPSFHISAFPISAFSAFLCVSALSPVPESETAQ